MTKNLVSLKREVSMSIDRLRLDANLEAFNIIQAYKKILYNNDKNFVIDDEIVKKTLKIWKDSNENQCENNEDRQIFNFLIHHIIEITIESDLKESKKNLHFEELKIIKTIKEMDSLQLDRIDVKYFKKTGDFAILKSNKLIPDLVHASVIEQYHVLISSCCELNNLLLEIIKKFQKIPEFNGRSIYALDLSNFFNHLSFFQQMFGNFIQNGYCGTNWENLAYELLQMKERFATILNELLKSANQIKLISKRINYILMQKGNDRIDVAYRLLNSNFGLNSHKANRLFKWKHNEAKESWMKLSQFFLPQQILIPKKRKHFFIDKNIDKRKKME